MNIFEITIQHRTENCWPVSVEYTLVGNLPIRREGSLNFDPTDWGLSEDKRKGKPLEDAIKERLRQILDPRKYGELLGKSLFHGKVDSSFKLAQSQSQGNLHILLVIEDSGLKTLHWERLCAIQSDGNWDFLSCNQNNPFSLYLPYQPGESDPQYSPISKKDLRALVLIADTPENNKKNLAPFDANLAAAGIQASMGEIPHDFLANIKGALGPPTLNELCMRITGNYYTLLHIMAHGQFNANEGETILYLHKDGKFGGVSASDFVNSLKNIKGVKGLPHFVFFSTCYSAVPEAEGLAQQMVQQLGIPAVLAMTDKITIETANNLSAKYYKKLQEHGKVDLALVEACAGMLSSHDITIPALYSRLGGRPLFSLGDHPLTDSEIESGLTRMETELTNRAPILLSKGEYQKKAKPLRETLGTDIASLSTSARRERDKALEEINALCEKVFEDSNFKFFNFKALASDQKPPAYDNSCPFPGLRPFRDEFRKYFFGREALVKRLLDRIQNEKFIAILGGSGSGKSSVVLAGIIPGLENDPEFQQLYMRPGKEPDKKLEDLKSQISKQNPLIIIDQFEELFTHCNEIETRRKFLDSLLEIIRNRHDIKIVITMRADFLADCAPYSEFKGLIQNHLELLAPMNTSELRSAMEQQAAKVRLRFEADLSHTILQEVQDEPGAMPLLQHLLLELWKRRHGRWLMTSEYQEMGGIRQAIAHTADELYKKFSETETNYMRNIFIRLTNIGGEAASAGDYRDVRRRISMEELVPAGDDPQIIRQIVEKLADASLVVTKSENSGQTKVEVAHEALIRYWPRLRRWLDEDRSSLRLLADIGDDALKWNDGNCQDNLLPHWNSRLEEAEILFRQPRFVQNDLEEKYIKACRALRDKEKDEKEEQERRLRQRFAIAVVVGIVAIIASVFARVQWRKANESLIEAKNNLGRVFNEKAKKAIENKNFNAAKLYALHALENFDSVGAWAEKNRANSIILNYSDCPVVFSSSVGSLNPETHHSLSFSPDGITVASWSSDKIILRDLATGKETRLLTGHTDNIRSVSFSPDGTTLASGSKDNTIRLWDVATGKEKKQIKGHASVSSVTFSPDGMILSSSLEDDTIILWEMITGREKIRLKGYNAIFSPDSKTIAFNENGNTIILWDVLTDKEKARMTSKRYCSFSPDGKTIALAGIGGLISAPDNTIHLWDVATGREKKLLKGHNMTFSPDGGTLALWSDDKIIHLWDVATDKEKKLLTGHEDSVNSVTFSPDGMMLASGSNDKTIRLWDVKTGKEKRLLTDHNRIINVSFSPDGRTLTSQSNSDQSDYNTICLWDMTISKEKRLLTGNTVRFSPDGKTLALEWRLLDVATEKEKTMKGHEYQTNSITFSPDGTTIALGLSDNTILLWDVITGNENRRLNEHDAHVVSVESFSPNSKILASWSSDSKILLWDVEMGKINAKIYVDSLRCMSFSPDSDIIALGGGRFTEFLFTTGTIIRLIDVKSGEEKGELKGHHFPVNSVSFSKDGRTLVSGAEDNTIRLWDVKTQQEKISALIGNVATFSPDGKKLASGVNNVIHMWDVATWKETLVLTEFEARIKSLIFSPDGKKLASVLDNNTIHLWDLSWIYDTRSISEQIKEAEQSYNLRLVNFELKPVEQSEQNIQPHPPKWSKTHPFHWLSKAEAGDTDAMVQLGIIYDRDNENDKALEWYKRAADNGNPYGKERLEFLSNWLTHHKENR